MSKKTLAICIRNEFGKLYVEQHKSFVDLIIVFAAGQSGAALSPGDNGEVRTRI